MSHACGCATICVYHGELVPKSHIATLTAENERLRAIALDTASDAGHVRGLLEQAEARVAALEAALEAVIHAFHPKFYQGCTAPPCDRVRAALARPTPTPGEGAGREQIAYMVKCAAYNQPFMGVDWTRPENQRWLDVADRIIALTAPAPHVPRPADAPKVYNASTEPCDMLDGPCACGGWHTATPQGEQGV